MVRAGVVDHHFEWPFGGYSEIQSPRRKCVLVAYHKLAELSGFDNHDRFRDSHKRWVEEIKEKINVRAKGRKAVSAVTAFQLREPVTLYNTVLDLKKEYIGHENIYSWGESSVFNGILWPDPKRYPNATKRTTG